MAVCADLDPLVEARVEEAEDHPLAEEREALAQGQGEAAGEDLTDAPHRRRSVDEHHVRPLLVLHLLLVGEVEELVVDELLLEDVLVERELGEDQIVEVAPALDRSVAVDREGLLPRVAADLQERGQQLHREVDDVGERRRDHHRVEVRQIDAAGGLAGAAAEEAEEAQSVDVELFDGEDRQEAEADHGLDPGDRLRRIVAVEGGPRIDPEVEGCVGGQLHRPHHPHRLRELRGDRGEEAREHHPDHRVAVLPARLRGHQLRRRELVEEAPPAVAELTLGDPLDVGRRGPEARDQAPQIVGDHERHRVAEAGQDGMPGDRPHQRQRARALDLREREGADLALDLRACRHAAAPLSHAAPVRTARPTAIAPRPHDDRGSGHARAPGAGWRAARARMTPRRSGSRRTSPRGACRPR